MLAHVLGRRVMGLRIVPWTFYRETVQTHDPLGPSAPFGGNSGGESENKLLRLHHTQKAMKTTAGVGS